MFNFLKQKKLHFSISEGAGSITLTEALRGAAGSVHLNDIESHGVFLWTPNAKNTQAQEAVCDLRFSSLSPEMANSFKQATAHMLLPAKICVFQGTNPHKIKEALTYFDYVLIPSKSQRNDWHNLFKTRILGYTPRNTTRLREILTKKVH